MTFRLFHHRLRHRLLVLLLALLPIGSAPAAESAGDEARSDDQQAEAPDKAGDEPSASGAEPAPDSAAAGSGDGRTGAPEIFVPTEEISEDFAVSFPVDI